MPARDVVRWHCEAGDAWFDLVATRGRERRTKGRGFIAEYAETRIGNGKE